MQKNIKKNALMFQIIFLFAVVSAACHPECFSGCSNEVIFRPCEPKCQPPRCIWTCPPTVETNMCHVFHPRCEIQCEHDQCEADACPACETFCDAPHPEFDCEAQGCQVLCQAPECAWECSNPSNTTCTWECETPACEASSASTTTTTIIVSLIITLFLI